MLLLIFDVFFLTILAQMQLQTSLHMSSIQTPELPSEIKTEILKRKMVLVYLFLVLLPLSGAEGSRLWHDGEMKKIINSSMCKERIILS